MAKPDAAIHSEIRRGCCESFRLRRSLGSLHRRKPTSSLHRDGAKRPEMCENGKQGVPSSSPSRVVSKLACTSESEGKDLRRDAKLETSALEATVNETPVVKVSICVLVSSGDRGDAVRNDSYLVDPASSHMLVSKIKPCMSKYNHDCTGKLRMAH